MNFRRFYPFWPRKSNDSMLFNNGAIWKGSRCVYIMITQDLLNITATPWHAKISSICSMCDVCKSTVWQITRILHTNCPYFSNSLHTFIICVCQYSSDCQNVYYANISHSVNIIFFPLKFSFYLTCIFLAFVLLWKFSKPKIYVIAICIFGETNLFITMEDTDFWCCGKQTGWW